jgi:hypothetical protein
MGTSANLFAFGSPSSSVVTKRIVGSEPADVIVVDMVVGCCYGQLEHFTFFLFSVCLCFDSSNFYFMLESNLVITISSSMFSSRPYLCKA